MRKSCHILPRGQVADKKGSKTTFSHDSYANFRPTYSTALFDIVLAYYNAGRASAGGGTLVDLGCGPGQISRALASYFTTVIGVDPSPGMVAQAKSLTGDPKITIRQGSAEDLSPLADSSVDLAVAGAAAHWFDFGRAWPELARVVKKGAAAAFWGYIESVITGCPQTSQIHRRFMFSTGEVKPGIEGLGRFWEDAGGDVLRGLYEAIVPPEADWEDVTRIKWRPDDSPTSGIEKAPKEALWLRKRLTLGEYADYIRTYSACNNWKAAYPDKKSKAEGGDGDVVDALMEEFVEAVPEWRAAGDKWSEVEVEVVWATCLVMARRK